jgi:hypothetical protein
MVDEHDQDPPVAIGSQDIACQIAHTLEAAGLEPGLAG